MKRSKTKYCLIVLLALLSHSAPLLSQSQSPVVNSKSHKNRILRVDGQVAPFKAWLEQDVLWIITTEEKAAFKTLQNDEERDEFVEAVCFAAIRHPTPTRTSSKRSTIVELPTRMIISVRRTRAGRRIEGGSTLSMASPTA